MDKSQIRKKFREQWEREWIRDAMHLRNKKPEETLKAMFDLCNFAEKFHKAGETKQ